MKTTRSQRSSGRVPAAARRYDRAAERGREVEQRLRSLGVELRGRLVEQEEPRTKNERRCNTDTLELAGGELVGLPAGEMLGAHPPERLEGANRDLERRHAEVLEPELELVLDAGHHDLVLRVLEDGGDRPARSLGRAVRVSRPPTSTLTGEPAAVEVRHQAGERAQQRRLSRPDGPSRQTSSPGWISSETSSSAGRPSPGYRYQDARSALEPQRPHHDDGDGSNDRQAVKRSTEATAPASAGPSEATSFHRLGEVQRTLERAGDERRDEPRAAAHASTASPRPRSAST